MISTAFTTNTGSNMAKERHPTESRGNRKLITPTLSLASPDQDDLVPEFRSRHRSATNDQSKPMSRMNLYKRPDNSGPLSPRDPITDHVPIQPDSPKIKRENWLRRSLRSARGSSSQKSNQPISNGAPKTPINHRSDRIATDSMIMDSPKKSPLLGSAMAGILDKLKSKSSSDGLSPDRLSLSLGAKRKTGTTSMDSAQNSGCNSPILSSEQWTYERRGSSQLSTPFQEDPWINVLKDDDIDDQIIPTRRKRSCSDGASYIIMRKTSRPNTAEVMGSINRREVACKQLLKKFICYDLMPTQGALVAIDSQLPTHLALASLTENNVRAAFLWDSRQRSIVCIVTVTDFLRIMYSQFYAGSPTQQEKDISDVLDKPILSNLINASTNIDSPTPRPPKRYFMTTVSSEDTLMSALTVLRLNRLHRIPVIESETGNPLYLLSTKRVLHFLNSHMHSLPMSTSMYKTLDELRIGTWTMNGALITLTSENSMIDAVEKFLQSGASSLPILEVEIAQNGTTTGGFGVEYELRASRLLDALTKVDLMHFVVVNGWNDLNEKTVMDVLRMRDTHMETLITCHRKTPLALVIDRMVQMNAHRIYVVESDGTLQAVVSIGDLLSYLSDRS